MIATKKESMKNVYGVPEIDGRFLNSIKELCFQQIKGMTVKRDELAR